VSAFKCFFYISFNNNYLANLYLHVSKRLSIFIHIDSFCFFLSAVSMSFLLLIVIDFTIKINTTCIFHWYRSLCYSLSPSTQFVEKLLHSTVIRLFSQTEQSELCVTRTDAVTSAVPLHTAFTFPSPGWYLIAHFLCTLCSIRKVFAVIICH